MRVQVKPQQAEILYTQKFITYIIHTLMSVWLCECDQITSRKLFITALAVIIKLIFVHLQKH